MTLALRAAVEPAGPVRPPAPRRFANADAICEGWYAVATARGLGRGRIVPVSIGKRDLVLYRDAGGTLRALDRACGHLGADLSKGTITAKGLQCAFHRWCWGDDGRCTAGGGAARGARIGGYDVRERWGLAWIWAGRNPAYDLPLPEPSNRAHVLRLPAQRLRCHAHVVLGNGLDLTHVIPVHRFRFLEDPIVEAAADRLSVSVRTRFDPTMMRRLLGVANREARWRFTNIGPSLAWVSVSEPTPFELVWAARPLPDGSCVTQTLFFLPKRTAIVRALPMMVATTWADRRVLEDLKFTPGFVPSDAVFARYVDLIEGLPEW